MTFTHNYRYITKKILSLTGYIALNVELLTIRSYISKHLVEIFLGFKDGGYSIDIDRIIEKHLTNSNCSLMNVIVCNRKVTVGKDDEIWADINHLNCQILKGFSRLKSSVHLLRHKFTWLNVSISLRSKTENRRIVARKRRNEKKSFAREIVCLNHWLFLRPTLKSIRKLKYWKTLPISTTAFKKAVETFKEIYFFFPFFHF